MNVKELKEILKDIPDHLEVVTFTGMKHTPYHSLSGFNYGEFVKEEDFFSEWDYDEDDTEHLYTAETANAIALYNGEEYP